MADTKAGTPQADVWVLPARTRLHAAIGQGDKAPHIFQVNWFRKDADGRFLWPGFGDNARPIEWAIKRVLGEVDADDAISGRLPQKGDLNVEGLDIDDATLEKIFALDP